MSSSTRCREPPGPSDKMLRSEGKGAGLTTEGLNKQVEASSVEGGDDAGEEDEKGGEEILADEELGGRRAHGSAPVQATGDVSQEETASRRDTQPKTQGKKLEEDAVLEEKGDPDRDSEGDTDREEEGGIVKQEGSATREEEENANWEQDESTSREEEERATGKNGTEDRRKWELISEAVEERAGSDAGGISHTEEQRSTA
ncbi:hypothetical protein NDU88_008864 [Pleurodeles waltl]|uniref:Uncharacterized protein n=1 Tax=Pleurodeles waltl TaxID=8319 RepID=A0AAV7PQD7_PLEWA|nr:hypothetical protein NDU88_008864 [Pleurodeles waltl]